MRPVILTIITLFLTILSAEAVRKINVNPVNLAVVIVEKSDSADIASTFDYYGYTLTEETDGYKVMRHPNGDEIRYSFSDKGILQTFPIVIVKAKENSKALGFRLNELKFEKTRDVYERKINRYGHHVTQCISGPHGTLTFRRLTKYKAAK